MVKREETEIRVETATKPKPFTDGNNQKTLSKNALYTPLAAYEQTQVDPSTYMTTQISTIPKSLKEHSLSVFLQKVSFEYHRNRATASDPKNNGSRPLSVGDIDDRIKRRAVTLIGGGVNSSMTSKQIKSETKSRKRPRREWNDVKSSLRRKHPGRTRSDNDDSIQFLRQLNSSWNDYMAAASILGLNSSSSSSSSSIWDDDLMAIKARFALARRAQIELVGAHVKVATCPQKKNLVGTLGVLVGETKNTWSVVRLCPSREDMKDPKDAGKPPLKLENDKPVRTSGKHHTELVTIPKRGSSLVLMIPITPSLSDAKEEATMENHEEEKELIVQADRFICITLDPR
jgi:RNase P/RNase MRP subunit p29